MNRAVLLSSLVSVWAAGCAPQPVEMTMQKPEPAPELARLKKLVGTWTGTAEIVSAMPQHEAGEGAAGKRPPPSPAGAPSSGASATCS